jgi:hypothetical protein
MKPFKEVINGIRKAVMASEVREDIAQMGEYVEQFANTAGENIKKAIDPTLSLSGKAADAAKVGELKKDLGKICVQSRIGFFETPNEKYKDLNNIPQNSIVTYGIAAIKSLSNAPTNFKSGFTLITGNYTPTTASGAFQLAFNLVGGEFAHRVNANRWSNWTYVSSKEQSRQILYVGSTRNGANCFKTLKECTEYIKNNNVFNSTVYVDGETFDLVNEYGNDYLESLNVTGNQYIGLLVGNNTHFIFNSNAKVIFNYTGTNANVAEHFSAFNIIGSCTIENCTVEVSNARYCVHEDTPASGTTITNYTVKYINCIMEHKGNTLPYNGTVCIGAGTQAGSTSIIEGGSYKCSTQFPWAISYHNNGGANYPLATVIINNAYINNGVRFAQLSSSSLGKIRAVFSNCYAPKGTTAIPSVVELITWNIAKT